MKTSAEDVVQVLLLSSEVLALTGHLESERVAVEPQALLGVAYDYGGVIYAQEQFVRWLAPLCCSFVGRKLQNLERVTVRVFEVERFDSGCRFYGFRKRLGT